MRPYFEGSGVTIYHGDARDVLPTLAFDVIVTDPPYGRTLRSSRSGAFGDCAVAGDEDTQLRDWLVDAITVPAAVFGSWQIERPKGYRWVLIWDKGEHVGMGDLSWPWKPNYEGVYLFGDGWQGRRTGSVLRYNAIAGTVALSCGRHHPTEKPVSLMGALLGKAPAGVVLDPFAGSGSTLIAATLRGRRAIGIEREERYCATIARRLSQQVLPLVEVMA